jgi:nuclear-control-of-ATPase protein 2
MACQRGPRAFVEAACGMLSRLRSNWSPFPYLLNSANCMLTTKRARLKSMKHCLAAFLAEVCIYLMRLFLIYNKATFMIEF